MKFDIVISSCKKDQFVLQKAIESIKVSKTGWIGDGHHRCAILYYLYGPEYEIKLLGNWKIDNVLPLV